MGQVVDRSIFGHTHPWVHSVLLKDIWTKAMAYSRCLQPDRHMYSVHQDLLPTHNRSQDVKDLCVLSMLCVICV